MRIFRALTQRPGGLFRSESDFEAELESHIDLLTDALIAAGFEPHEGRRQAPIHLGGREQACQAHRERRTLPWLEALLEDSRYGLRMLARNPGFTTVTACTLAIGIGASTAIFSAIKPILIDPLTNPHASRPMMLSEMRKDGAARPVTFLTFRGLGQHSHGFSSLAVFKSWQPASTSTSQPDRPERLDGQRVSADYFRTLGVSTSPGRNFQPSDDRFQGPNLAILNDRLWRRRFTADPSVIGKQVRLDDELSTVIGVMPGAFENVLNPSAEIWAPLQYNPAVPFDGREWGQHLQCGAVRLGEILLQGLDENATKDPLVAVTAHERRIALILFEAFGLIALALAAIGIYGVLAGSVTERTREIGVRSALGATRVDILALVLGQGMTMTVLGLAVGLSMALVAARALNAMLFDISWLDRLSYLSAILLQLAVSFLACLLPARRAAAIDPIKALRNE